MVELVTVERIRDRGRELAMADVDLVVPVSAIEGWSGQTARQLRIRPGSRLFVSFVGERAFLLLPGFSAVGAERAPSLPAMLDPDLVPGFRRALTSLDVVLTGVPGVTPLDSRMRGVALEVLTLVDRRWPLLGDGHERARRLLGAVRGVARQLDDPVVRRHLEEPVTIGSARAARRAGDELGRRLRRLVLLGDSLRPHLGGGVEADRVAERLDGAVALADSATRDLAAWAEAVGRWLHVRR